MKDYFVSDAKFLKLDISIPYDLMLEEAAALKMRFTEHRPGDHIHQGWKSLSLYGLGEDKHESWQEYGYANAAEAAANFKWTAAADECPTIVNWLKTKFPSQRFGRIRIMLVEANGFIGPHIDTAHRILENINIPLSNPRGCMWKWGDGEELFMEPGGIYAMNISYEHSIHNNSNDDRYHLIVARHDSTDEWKALMEQAAVEPFHYVTHEIAT